MIALLALIAGVVPGGAYLAGCRLAADFLAVSRYSKFSYKLNPLRELKRMFRRRPARNC